MHPITPLVPLLLGVAAAIAESPYGLRIGVDHPAPPDPAFPFTDLCIEWRLQYLVSGGELSLWTRCAGPSPQSSVVSLLALDSSLVASKQGIQPAHPSNAAPVSFSSTCRDCILPNTGDSLMACNCTANQGMTLWTVDLAEWITAEQGVPCFTDGVVYGTVQSSTGPYPSSSSSSSSIAKKPKCTKA